MHQCAIFLCRAKITQQQLNKKIALCSKNQKGNLQIVVLNLQIGSLKAKRYILLRSYSLTNTNLNHHFSTGKSKQSCSAESLPTSLVSCEIQESRNGGNASHQQVCQLVGKERVKARFNKTNDVLAYSNADLYKLVNNIKLT